MNDAPRTTVISTAHQPEFDAKYAWRGVRIGDVLAAIAIVVLFVAVRHYGFSGHG